MAPVPLYNSFEDVFRVGENLKQFMKQNITILGAGLVGSLLSIYLAKRGHKVEIYERRGDMRTEKMLVGRSINLALSDRGWKGLRGVGLEDEIRAIAIPMNARLCAQWRRKRFSQATLWCGRPGDQFSFPCRAQ